MGKWWRNSRRLIIFLAVEFFTIYGMYSLFPRFFIWGLICYVVWYLVTNWKLLSKTNLEDWFNPLKYASVAYAFFMKLLFPMHIVEQLILRMFDSECRRCAVEGACFECKCDASKMYVPWEWCSRENWGSMIEDADEYYAMRKEFPVVITVRYPREENPNAGFYEFIGHKANSNNNYTDGEGKFDHVACLQDIKPVDMTWEEFVFRVRRINMEPAQSISFDVPADAKPGDEYIINPDGTFQKVIH